MYNRMVAFLVLIGVLLSPSVYAVICNGVDYPNVVICAGETEVDCDDDYINNANDPNDGPIHYLAIWAPKTYPISYGSGNHGSVPNNGADPVVYQDGLTYGSTWTTKTFAETGIVADTGYVFSGWNTSADGSGTSYTANTQQSAWTTDSGLTLYAIYGCDTSNGYIESNDFPGSCVGRFTVTYKSGTHGNGQDYVVVVADGDEHDVLEIFDVGIVAQNGYHFNGWDCGFEDIVEPGSLFDIEGSDVICVAQWTPNEIGLNWLLNSGNWMIDSNGNELSNQNSCDYGTLNGITVYDPVRRGFGFIGWEVEGVSDQ